MTNLNSWSRFIDATSNGDLNRVIAERVGVDPATIGRWRSGAVEPKPRQVIEYARVYGLSPLSGLIAASYLTEEELSIEVVIPMATLADFSIVALAEELTSRVKREHGVRTDLFPHTDDPGDDKPYVTLPTD